MFLFNPSDFLPGKSYFGIYAVAAYQIYHHKPSFLSKSVNLAIYIEGSESFRDLSHNFILIRTLAAC